MRNVQFTIKLIPWISRICSITEICKCLFDAERERHMSKGRSAQSHCMCDKRKWYLRFTISLAILYLVTTKSSAMVFSSLLSSFLSPISTNAQENPEVLIKSPAETQKQNIFQTFPFKIYLINFCLQRISSFCAGVLRIVPRSHATISSSRKFLVTGKVKFEAI